MKFRLFRKFLVGDKVIAKGKPGRIISVGSTIVEVQHDGYEMAYRKPDVYRIRNIRDELARKIEGFRGMLYR